MTDVDMYGKPGAEEPGPSGIGGWLVLPLIGLVLTIALTLFNLWQAYQAFTPSAFDAIVNATEPPLTTLRDIVLLSFGGGTILLATATTSLVLFLGRKRQLPAMIIVHLLTSIAVSLAEFYASQQLLEFDASLADVVDSFKQLVRSLIAACLWIPYFVISRRVKNTFVR